MSLSHRKSFLEKIWKCCRTLFSLGPLERRDAYNVLSMYFSSLPCMEQCDVADTSVSEEEFDIRSEKEFWDEIKRGLVTEFSFLNNFLLSRSDFLVSIAAADCFVFPFPPPWWG